MTIYPKQKHFKKLFNFYDGLVKEMVDNGMEKYDAKYAVCHFLKVFSDNPEEYRIEQQEKRRKIA